jgi:hypothetical protein
MSTQIVRLANGDSIQVRTGVLRGSGPAGPPGPSNGITIGTVVTGDTAAATLSGDSPAQTLDLVLPRSTVAGPAGSVNDFLTSVSTSTNYILATNTDHTISFSTVSTDELAMLVNSTTFRPVTTGADRVLSFTVKVIFYNNGVAGSGYREGRVLLNGSTIIGEEVVEAVSLSTGRTALNMPVIHRFSAGDTFQVIAKHGGSSSVSVGSVLRAIRVGAGPAGPQGPEGPANTLTVGTVSTLSTGTPATATVTGTAPNQVLNLGLPKGDTGPSGTAGSGYSAIHELDGTGGNTA